jgi:hypothetical protein
MTKLQELLRRLTITHIMLFLIAAGLALNGAELFSINRTLVRVVRSVVGIDADLTTPIDVNVTNPVEVNTDH